MMKLLCGVILIVLSIFFNSASGVVVPVDPDTEGYGLIASQTLNLGEEDEQGIESQRLGEEDEQGIESQRLNPDGEDVAELESKLDYAEEMGACLGKNKK